VVHAPGWFRLGWAFAAVGRLVARAPALSAALVALLAASALLTASHSSPSVPIPGAAAVRAVAHDRVSGPALAKVRYASTAVYPIDSGLEQVCFYRGGRLVFEAALRADGTVREATDSENLAIPYGSPIAFRSIVLAVLGLAFVLLAAVAPLRRIRNLDVAVLVGCTAPMLLLEHGFVGASVVTGALALVYLLVRCAWWSLAPARPRPPSIALYDVLTARWTGARRRRTLLLLAGAAALTFLMVGVSATQPIDVIYAVMEGATNLLHGVLPYGHLPGDVIHGDTYPILSYALYTPVAALTPVSSTWDAVDVALGAGILAVLAAAACVLVGVARMCRDRPGHVSEDRDAGLRTATAFLCFPPLLAIVSSGTTDVALGALLALAVVLWRRPSASAAVLGVAGWFKLAPLALLAVWLGPLRGRRLLGALAALAAVSGGSLAIVLALGGGGGLRAMAHAVAYQFNRGSFQSVWHTLGLQSLQPFAQAGVLALAAAGAVRLRVDPRLAADPRRVAALAAAVLAGLQLVMNDWTFLYLAWIAPLVSISLLGEESPVARTALARSLRFSGPRRAPRCGRGLRAR
jgi:Glycosyltransferase family 87